MRSRARRAWHASAKFSSFASVPTCWKGAITQSTMHLLEHAEREVEQVCASRIVSLNTRRCPAKRAKAEACHLEGADHAGEEGHSKGGQSERGTGSALMSCPFTESRHEDVLAFYMKAITDRPQQSVLLIIPLPVSISEMHRGCQSVNLSEGSSVTKLKSMAASVLSGPIHFFTCSQHDVVNRSCLGRCVCNRNASVGIVINLQLRDFDVFRLRRPKMPLNVARPCF